MVAKFWVCLVVTGWALSFLIFKKEGLSLGGFDGAVDEFDLAVVVVGFDAGEMIAWSGSSFNGVDRGLVFAFTKDEELDFFGWCHFAFYLSPLVWLHDPQRV